MTFADALVRDASRRFVALRLDATNDDGPDVLRWQKEYALTGLPTVIIVDARGQERARITELVTPAAMLEQFAEKGDVGVLDDVGAALHPPSLREGGWGGERAAQTSSSTTPLPFSAPC